MICKKHNKEMFRWDEFVGCIDCWAEVMKNADYAPGIQREKGGK